MAIVVYLETENGNFKKSALEVSSYGRKLADETKSNLYGIAFNSDEPLKIQKYGVEKLINIKTDHVFDAKSYADLLCKTFTGVIFSLFKKKDKSKSILLALTDGTPGYLFFSSKKVSIWILKILKNHKYILTVEDGCIMGGFGSSVIEFMVDNNYKNPVQRLGIPDKIIEHGSQDELYNE